MAYFAGTNAIVAPSWCIATMIGAVAGNTLPESWSLDFALPIAFLAMVGPMLRTPAHMIAAGVAVAVAILAAGVPHNLGLIIAGLSGMLSGAGAETIFENRKARRA